MKFTVGKTVFAKFPKAKFGALVIKDVDNSLPVSKIKELLDYAVKEVNRKYGEKDPKDIPEISRWRKTFKTLGLDPDILPSHEALVKRALSSKQIPSINPLVDIYNTISLSHLIPIGGHDLGKVKDIRIDKTTGEETFQVMNKDEVEQVEAGEIAYLSDNKVLTRNFVWRQAETSKTDENTKRIFIPIDDATGALRDTDIESIAQKIVGMIKKYLGGEARFTIVSKDKPEIDFAKVKPMEIKVQKVSASKSAEINTDPKAIDEFLDRGPIEIFTRDELRKRLLEGKQLSAYIGYDVTGPDLHIGHGSTMMKLRDWQELGHKVILVIGDYTSRVGDHSDKLEKRKRLTVEEIEENKRKFVKQFGRIIDLDRATVKYNSEWLSPLSFNDVIGLASLFSVQQMIERENFAKRLKSQKSIGLEEFLYPLMQGYDSVALKVDLEIGGTDQTFNMLAGRRIQEHFGLPAQNVITMPLIPGTDGRKMSKSLNNYIAMLSSANDIYGGIMSCTDDVLIEYFRLLTRVPIVEIAEMAEALKTKKADPMELKKRLAREVTRIYHGEDKAREAEEYFESTFQNKETPDDAPEYKYEGQKTALEFLKFLVEKGEIYESNADAKRLVKQGSILVDNTKIQGLEQDLELKEGSVVKIGKRRFVRLG